MLAKIGGRGQTLNVQACLRKFAALSHDVWHEKGATSGKCEKAVLHLYNCGGKPQRPNFPQDQELVGAIQHS